MRQQVTPDSADLTRAERTDEVTHETLTASLRQRTTKNQIDYEI